MAGDLPNASADETDNEDAGRRGRKATPPNPDGGPVAAFAHELWDLKRRAGDPSYAAMRTRLGAAVSRSSLSAATRGTALPSWETTWEFVRVLAVDTLGADADDTRREWWARWKAAGAAEPGGANAPPQVPAPPGEAPEPQAAGTPPRPVVRLTFTQLTAAVVAALVVVASVGLLVGWSFAPSAEPAPESTVDNAHLDDAAFEGDITIPDGTVVTPSQVFTKVWQLRNTGQVRWEGRYLTRMNTTECSAPGMVPIPTTDPGESVRITVRVTASPTPAHCKIYWKATDASRRLLFPDKNPIFLDVTVRE
ncbi:Ig-like domain-containing protein [Micromonospora pisi]|uniref:Ig-like domain-containing protein n=1 Tax=Micromonospora pisi TaxID=589240 RepID=A0A495JTM1_9ACTN|nr:NBR1-Ig-like domain-containing protein [Micromonospora pisi]RKR92181.1 Ig-like domain-containing protein [Micromonospora pisi]